MRCKGFVRVFDKEARSVEYKLNATGPWWYYCEGSQAVGVLMSLQAVYRSWVCFDVHENNCLLIYS